jgi:hypothetical protein
LRINIDGSLQIQFVEANHLLDRFRASLVDHSEMYLAVHEPLVGHVVHRAII